MNPRQRECLAQSVTIAPDKYLNHREQSDSVNPWVAWSLPGLNEFETRSVTRESRPGWSQHFAEPNPYLLGLVARFVCKNKAVLLD